MGNKAPVLTYYDISPSVIAFSTTRHGGVSIGDYGEMNINPYCGDSADNVARNRELLAQTLGVNTERLVMPHQTHGTEIRQIAEDFFHLPTNIQQMLLEGVDTVMTDVSDVCIGVSTADCIPILLYDKAHHTTCAAHAGWRGTVAGIARKAVTAMGTHYHSAPIDIQAVIGPGISLDAFEVGDEVYEEFAAAGFDMDAISRRKEKWHIDLWECNRRQLLDAGISEGNIHTCGICTYNNADDYFSARRLGTASGRIYTGIVMK